MALLGCGNALLYQDPAGSTSLLRKLPVMHLTVLLQSWLTNYGNRRMIYIIPLFGHGLSKMLLRSMQFAGCSLESSILELESAREAVFGRMKNILVASIIGEPRAQIVQLTCSRQLEQNTTTFVKNRIASVENIGAQIQNSGFGVSISGTGPDTSYGLAQCYGDLSPIDCSLCYVEASNILPECFPYNGGRIILDGCFVRAENYSFFHEFTGPQDMALCGNITQKGSAFQELATRAVLQSVTEAANQNGSAHVEFQAAANGDESAFVLADCWKSLDPESCRACLENASESIRGCLPWSEGRALNTGCFMRYSASNFLNPIPTGPSTVVPSSVTSRFPMAKPECRDTCGNNVTIPYPFGIGSGCALSESYTISCQRRGANQFLNDPMIPFINVRGIEYQVLEVSLMDQTVTVTSLQGNFSCYGGVFNNVGTYGSLNLVGTPFFYSKEHNRLTLLGCGNALLYQNPVVGRSRVLSGCTSTCFLASRDTSSCFGFNCCQTDIPLNLKQYWINFTSTETSNSTAKCTTAILVDKRWKPEDDRVLPVVWSWTLQNSSQTDAILGCSRKSSTFELESGNFTTYGCECKAFGPLTWYYEINPYLNGSCEHASSVINGVRKNTRVAVISATTGLGTLILIILVLTSYKMLKKWHRKKRREKYFKQNGGLLLQQQLSSDERPLVEKTNIFSAKELVKASDGFNVNRVLGEGGQGTVYKGMLTDGRIVAIKKSKVVGEKQLEQLINEVVILSQVNHKNVVKVLGCCLETEVPLVVYEFIPNGTLYNLIHKDHDKEFPLTWSMKLRIAMEVASAMAYLHSSISTPIFHKDIKSSNILLDETYTAKVADFGTSRSVAIDKTHLTTRVQGTFGYFDPHYFQSGKFTDKSDVYSFGVVLIELLTGQKAISACQGEDSDIGLANRFLEAMEKDILGSSILDPRIMADRNDEDQVIAVAKLAQRCVSWNGKIRPSMKKVSMELESLKLSKLPDSSTKLENPPSNHAYSEEIFCDNTWTFSRETTASSALDSIPLCLIQSD